MTEVRKTSRTGGQKGAKPQRMDLLPWDTLLELSEHYAKGAEKYESHNWRKGYDWSLSLASLFRHAASFAAGEDFDPETGSLHVAGAAFHALTLMTFYREHPDFDDRYKGVATWQEEESSHPNSGRTET